MFSMLFDLANIAISICLPLVATFKALRLSSTDSSGNLKPWVIYWLIFALESAFESRFGFILRYVPLIGLMRLYVSLWLVLPQTRGAEFLYYHYVDPFLHEHEETVDKVASCIDPSVLIKVVSEYFGFNLSRFATVHKSSTTSQNTLSYVDKFVESFGKTAASKQKPTLLEQGGLVDSLLGVLKVAQYNADVGSKSLNSESDSSQQMKQTSSPASESSEFDVVGKEELENFVQGKNEKATDKGSQGWFSSWWSQDKSKKA